MQGWRGVTLAQELETSAKGKKKKKESKHSTSVAVMHQRETCTSELTAPEPPSIHLHSCNLADSNRTVYLLEGEKTGLVFWRWELLFPSRHLPLKQRQSLYTEPIVPVLCRFCLGVYDFLCDTSTEVTLPGLQKQVSPVVFPESIETESVRANQDFHHLQKGCFVFL